MTCFVGKMEVLKLKELRSQAPILGPKYNIKRWLERLVKSGLYYEIVPILILHQIHSSGIELEREWKWKGVLNTVPECIDSPEGMMSTCLTAGGLAFSLRQVSTNCSPATKP